MYSKVVGTTFAEGGQDALSSLKRGDLLVLQKEPNNKYDPQAIAVRLSNGKRIGYLPSKTANSIYASVGDGIKCTVSEVTGGGSLKNFGCNIFIEGFSNTS